MRRSIGLLTLAVGLLFWTVNPATAQAVKPEDRPASEKSLNALVDEVRQLRALLQRISQTAYKTNIVIERFKFQQDLVARIASELDNVRENQGELKMQSAKIKEMVGRTETGVEGGVKNPDDLAAWKRELDIITQREVRLAQRETQLVNDLAVERSKLMELTERLNSLELELK